jgi:hypothetical protein
MGLDIYSIERIEFVQPLPAVGSADWPLVDWDKADDEGWIAVYNHQCYPEHLAPFMPGFYVESGASVSFNAGSYSGYNAWRELLCKAVNNCKPHDIWEDRMPGVVRLREFIHFTDCEGVIGPLYATKLAAEMTDLRCRLAANPPMHFDHQGYFMELYDSWLGAFRIAASDGVVLFR